MACGLIMCAIVDDEHVPGVLAVRHHVRPLVGGGAHGVEGAAVVPAGASMRGWG